MVNRWHTPKILKAGLVMLTACAGLIGVVMIVSPQSVFATYSELSQEITPVGCEHDTYDTGKGVVNNPACPYFAPVISSYERLTGGGFRAYGAYDAIHTDSNPITGEHRLSIIFAGRTFTLGVDPELTVDGNAWELNLSAWRAEEPAKPSSPLTPLKPTTIKSGSIVDSQVNTIMKPNQQGMKQRLSGKASISMPNYPKNITKSNHCNDSSDANCIPSEDQSHSGLVVWSLIGIVVIEALWLIKLLVQKHSVKKINIPGV